VIGGRGGGRGGGDWGNLRCLGVGNVCFFGTQSLEWNSFQSLENNCDEEHKVTLVCFYLFFFMFFPIICYFLFSSI